MDKALRLLIKWYESPAVTTKSPATIAVKPFTFIKKHNRRTANSDNDNMYNLFLSLLKSPFPLV